MNTMPACYRLTRRDLRGGMYYCVDKTTGKRTSLQTTNRDEAQQVVAAKNQAQRQPVLNLQIAKAYLAGTDNGLTTRTLAARPGGVDPDQAGDRWPGGAVGDRLDPNCGKFGPPPQTGDDPRQRRPARREKKM